MVRKVLALILTLFLASNCANVYKDVDSPPLGYTSEQTFFVYGHWWKYFPPEEGDPDCQKVFWQVKPPEILAEGCGSDRAIACRFWNTCEVWSTMDEETAKKYMICGQSVYSHEAWHVLYNLFHPVSRLPEC